MSVKFLLEYDQPKKKGWGRKKAVFFDIRDAMMWERHILNQGCKNSRIRPL